MTKPPKDDSCGYRGNTPPHSTKNKDPQHNITDNRTGGDDAVTLNPFSAEEALRGLLQIPDPEKAIRDADAKSRKGRKKED